MLTKHLATEEFMFPIKMIAGLLSSFFKLSFEAERSPNMYANH